MNKLERLLFELETMTPSGRNVHEICNLKQILKMAIHLSKNKSNSKEKTDSIYSDIVTRLQKIKSGKPSYSSNRSNKIMEVLITLN